jgi:UPF0716 protein FxsA
MWPLLVVLLLAVPLAELWVVLRVADAIGLATTLAFLLLVSIAGASLLKQQGLAAWRRLQNTIGRGEIPSRELTDAVLIILGGALLLTPGFLTDALGLSLLLPGARAAVKGVARRWLARWARRRFDLRMGPPRVYSADVIGSRRHDGPDDPPRRPLAGEDGSRDRA